MTTWINDLAVATVVVEVSASYSPAETGAVLADWLTDYPEIADTAAVVVAAPEDVLPVALDAQELLAGEGDAQSLVLVISPRAAELAEAGVRTTYVDAIEDAAALFAVLDTLAVSVSFAPRRFGDGPTAAHTPALGLEELVAALPAPPPSVVDSRVVEEAPAAPTAPPRPRPRPARLPSQLLYLATLGPAPRSRRRQCHWSNELLRTIAANPGNWLVRLLALGDAIDDQSPLGVAADFLAVGRRGGPRALTTRDRLDLHSCLTALGAQLARDESQARFEGVDVRQTTLVVSVATAPAGLTHVAPLLAELQQLVTLIWVPADHKTGRILEDARVGTVLTEHPEVAAEIGRELGVGARSLDQRLLRPPAQDS